MHRQAKLASFRFPGSEMPGKAAYGPGHLLLAFGQFTLYAPSVFLPDSEQYALNLFFCLFIIAVVVDEAEKSGHGAGVDVEAESAVAAALAAQDVSRRADVVEGADGSARDLALLDPGAAVIELDHEKLHLLFYNPLPEIQLIR